MSRILNKKELNCQANRICTIEEGVDIPDRDTEFWSLLGGKQGVKCKSPISVPHCISTSLYHLCIISVSSLYHLCIIVSTLQPQRAHMQTRCTKEESSQPQESTNFKKKVPTFTLSLATPLLNRCSSMPCSTPRRYGLSPRPPTGGHLCIYFYYYFQIFLLDFVSEVYVWVGRQSPTKLRKRALELGKAHFDGDCKPAVFQHVPARTSVARASGRLRKNSLGRQSKHNLNASIRKTSKDAKPMTRPSWALFARVVEGGESILLREKFSDWPEQGRLIKMKGHEASVKLMVVSGLGRSTGRNGCVLAYVHKSIWLLTEHMIE